MSIKKYVALFVTVMAACAAFAEKNSYASHLAKAKEYEAKKQWIFALGEYYEAMLAEPTLAAEEAYNGWTALANDIKSGKPGHGEYGVFEQYDGWIALMCEYERYWTEYCPRVIVFNKPVRTEINSANRTATYTVGVSWRWSEKYSAMHDVITEGYKKAYSSEWNAEYLKDWPEKSVYNAPADKGKFLQNGAVQTQNRTTNKYGGYVYHSGSVEKPLYTEPAFSASFSYRNGSATMYATMYDIKFRIVDSDKKVIFQSPRFMLDYNYNEPVYLHTFTVSAEQMTLIDAGNITFVPEGVYLKYGDHPINVDILPNSREWVKNLPEIQIALDKVTFEVCTETNRDMRLDANKFVVNVLGRLITSKANAEKELNATYQQYQQGISLLPNPELTTKTLIGYSYEGYYRLYNKLESENYFFAEMRKKLIAEYGEEKYVRVKNFQFCNALSRVVGLNPAYSVGGKTKNSYFEEIEFLIANYDNISCDTNASGYRLATDKERESLSAANRSYNGVKPIIVRKKK